MPTPTLWQKLTSEDNLYSAWLKVAGNMGAGGVDRVSIEDFELNLYDNLGIIKTLLENGGYDFLPLLKFEADKPSGGKRTLGIPAIRDRITQQAMVNVLNQVFEHEFLDCSYAYRPRKSAHQALNRVENYIKQECRWVVDADITSFFDTVNHSILIDLLATKIDDNKMLALINKLLDTEAVSNSVGISQGAVTSPLFSNIYLHHIHQVMSYCMNYNQHYTEKWIKRLSPDIKPISCAKIRDWLSDITPYEKMITDLFKYPSCSEKDSESSGISTTSSSVSYRTLFKIQAYKLMKTIQRKEPYQPFSN